MHRRTTRHRARLCAHALLATLLVFIQVATPLAQGVERARASAAFPPEGDAPESSPARQPLFHFVRTPVANGGELLTIFGKADAPRETVGEVGVGGGLPLVSILRDTLGDTESENDRLRYVWMHTYASPSARQRAASAVPFLYSRVGNRGPVSRRDAPPHVLDLSAPERDAWKNIFWSSLQMLLVEPAGVAVKASSRHYRRNVEDYRRAHVVRALAVLALFEADAGAAAGQAIFTRQELREIQARLALTQKTLGGLIDDTYLRQVHERESTKWQDTRGHNWEMLRQRAEAERLHFEPLTMPDGSATHAILWTTRADLDANPGRKFAPRFLNIRSPWGDKRLRDWRGYTESRYFDGEGRRVPEGTSGARRAEMIPLALYGLDHPRIPVLLVDFRDTLNPKGREVSRRVLKDVTSTLFSLSRFELAYTLGRVVYEWVSEKRGMDVNQPSRLRALSQLKLLLSLDASLDPELRGQIGERLERLSLNPLDNGAGAEARLARAQHAALLDYARRPDGLPARLDRDRRAELVPARHGRAAQIAFSVARTLSFGLYAHREGAAPRQQAALLDVERRLARHRKFLREVAKTSARVEVEWDVEEVRRALRYVAAHGERAGGQTSTAVARVFALTEDEEARRLALDCLYSINNETAKNSLVRIYRDQTQDARWRTLSAEYLRRAAREQKRISTRDARVIAAIGGNE